MLDQLLQQRLQAHKAAGLTRIREFINPKQTRFFCSNDYLGLAQHPLVIQALMQGAEKYGFGSGASQLVAGHHPVHEELEQAFASFLKRDRALFFTNGYVANLAILQALASSTDIIYQDKYLHASLIDAGKLSKAAIKRYRHRDLDHLEQLLQKSKTYTHRFIISEHFFSTTGTKAPLIDLHKLAEQYQSTLIIDDAHGLGVFDFPLTQMQAPILSCPLGKALGGLGAVVAGSNTMIEALMQFGRTYMYSTAPPPLMAYALLTSLAVMQKESWRKDKLQENIAYFKNAALKRDLPFLPSAHPIQALVLKDEVKTMRLSAALLQQGFRVSVMRPPSVPPGQTLLRISLNALHAPVALDDFLDSLKKNYAAIFL